MLNVISVTELYFIGRGITGTYYRFFETFFIISMIYLFLTFVTSRLLKLLERKLDGSRATTSLSMTPMPLRRWPNHE